MQVDIRKDPTGWINDVRNKKNGIKSIFNETYRDHLIEKVLMGLRLIDGITFNEISSVLDMDAVRKLIDNYTAELSPILKTMNVKDDIIKNMGRYLHQGYF